MKPCTPACKRKGCRQQSEGTIRWQGKMPTLQARRITRLATAGWCDEEPVIIACRGPHARRRLHACVRLHLSPPLAARRCPCPRAQLLRVPEDHCAPATGQTQCRLGAWSAQCRRLPWVRNDRVEDQSTRVEVVRQGIQMACATNTWHCDTGQYMTLGNNAPATCKSC